MYSDPRRFLASSTNCLVSLISLVHSLFRPTKKLFTKCCDIGKPVLKCCADFPRNKFVLKLKLSIFTVKITKSDQLFCLDFLAKLVNYIQNKKKLFFIYPLPLYEPNLILTCLLNLRKKSIQDIIKRISSNCSKIERKKSKKLLGSSCVKLFKNLDLTRKHTLKISAAIFSPIFLTILSATAIDEAENFCNMHKEVKSSKASCNFPKHS
ncbi:hypothetical protein BpHYR1_035514 [Brachionus plicatilis]|uniref:Uncharacterized protein n=1 Tax=Brachionus plicatilis TaxID=10195 RepID=A0A3M7SD39_BRAPC|nr:hypothetical protein BpHYR1_035514 [Brachionus plicatilis]